MNIIHNHFHPSVQQEPHFVFLVTLNKQTCSRSIFPRDNKYSAIRQHFYLHLLQNCTGEQVYLKLMGLSNSL